MAGTHSGAGKTTVALGLMAALVRRGLAVAPFKVGPDFIDPGHHGRITALPGRTLDGWMLSRKYNTDCFRRHSRAADVAVVEGVMGLFDGAGGVDESGSTAQIAKWLDLPVLLVVDAAAMARSAAALVAGFERFDPDLRFCGVVFNRIGGPGHLSLLRQALAGQVKMPCRGGLAPDPDIEIPERHLGLTTAADHPIDRRASDRLAARVEEGLDIDELLAALPERDILAPAAEIPRKEAGRVRIGVALDSAFCFYYPDNFDLLQAAGAELVFFSPIREEALPGDLGGLYLGGGYPELHAGTLSENRPMREAIRAASRRGMPIYAECGGFMYLCRGIETEAGVEHAMCGCFPLRVRMNRKMAALGYREVRLESETLLGGPGTIVRGHEFRYSSLIEEGAGVDRVYRVSEGPGTGPKQEGFQTGATLGSYIHLHFGSCPAAAQRFVDSCRRYAQEAPAW